ncbi:unnamed protein product [Paramecium sonneborni]|uniref:Transmembrane protein n=1 Tax=Paramecium sonneborni TaxID=65129 RepID=A0A8S1QMV7_9CILI|nr:unnamed protein product [Paramecium sonneborni]
MSKTLFDKCNQQTTLPCLEICGDQLVTGFEKRDFEFEYDGCYNCQYQCQPQCTKCIKGQCQECETKGWQLIHNIIHGDVKKFVKIKLQLQMNNVIMVIQMIKMVAKIVNILVGLDVINVIITQILVNKL